MFQLNPNNNNNNEEDASCVENNAKQQRKMRIGKMGNYTILQLIDGSLFKVDFDGVGSTFESLIPEELSIQEDPIVWASQGLHHTLIVTCPKEG